MRTSKNDLLRGYVRPPFDLMQAGWPLKVDLYRYTPMKNVLECVGKEGETLELEAFVTLSSNPSILILAREESINRVRATRSESIFEFDSSLEVA